MEYKRELAVIYRVFLSELPKQQLETFSEIFILTFFDLLIIDVDGMDFLTTFPGAAR